MIEKILFPVDFSPSCEAMAEYVKRAAGMFASEVTLVHVCDLTSHSGFELYSRPPQEIADEHWGLAGSHLDSFLASEFPLREYPRVLRSGNAATEIAEVARTGGFNLIVMPTHAGRFRRMIIGSITAKVLSDASCPVLTTEHALTVVPRILEHREWICAIDLSPDSERVLRLATRAAAQAHARLCVVHVAHNSVLAADAQQGLDELRKKVGCEAAVRVVSGPVKDTLLNETQQSAADVLIIGRPRAGALGRIGDLTYGLVRDSPFPVLSV